MVLPGMRVMIGESLQPSASWGASSCATTAAGINKRMSTRNPQDNRIANLKVEVTARPAGKEKYFAMFLRFLATRNLRVGSAAISIGLHPIIVRTATALRRHPGNDLIWILYVTRLAVNAVGRIEADALSIRSRGILEHFVNIRWTKILAWVAVFRNATRVANIGVMNNQMRRLIFLVPGA